MNALERRAVVSLAILFSLRMIGLFMILPVFAVYGRKLTGATPLLIGLAVGSYALAQAILQIPLSQLSDRIGRRKLILAGMALFALGGVIAALSQHIYGVILGRALQGVGAISGVVMALLSDLTRVEQRSKAMAGIGMSIGVAFAFSFVIGPPLAAQFGLSGLFWITAGMGLAGMALCHWYVPEPITLSAPNPQSYARQLGEVFADRELLKLNTGVFLLHLLLAASFMALPVLLRDAGLETIHHGWIYLPVMLLAFALMIPGIILAEKKRRIRAMLMLAVGLLIVSFIWLTALHNLTWQLTVGIAVFFIGFNLLEAMLPSVVSKVCPPQSKGTAMGVFATSQFLGAAIGSPMGAWLAGHLGYPLLFITLTLLALLWWLIVFSMASPPVPVTLTLSLPSQDALSAKKLAEKLQAVRGVEEVVLVPTESIAYLKVRREQLDEAALRDLGLGGV